MWERGIDSSEFEQRHYQELKTIVDFEGALFGDVLDLYLPSEFKPTKVLDICAGLMAEEDVILDYFDLNTESLVSVDQSDRHCYDAKKIGRKTILKKDLFNKNDIESIGNGYDLIIGRNVPLNPNLSENELELSEEWVDVFENLKKISTSNCVLFLTLFQDHEFFMAKKILEKSGFDNFLVAERNKIKITSKTNLVPDKYKDNFILIATGKKHQIIVRLNLFV